MLKSMTIRAINRYVCVLLLFFFSSNTETASNQFSTKDKKPSVTYETTVRLKLFDVLALDEDDKPVTGLTKDDFELYIDGRRMPVDTFDIMDFSEPPKNLPLGSTPGNEPDKTTVNYEYDDFYNNRLIILVFNDLRFFKGSRQSLANGVLDFIDKNISSHNLVSLYYMQGSAIILLLPFTNDKDAIKKSIIDNIIENKSNLAFTVPDHLIQNELWYAGNLESFKTPMEDLARQYKHINVMTSFHIFIRFLSLYKGRKELFIFSDAVPYKYYRKLQDFCNFIKLINDAKRNNIIINTFDLSKAGYDFDLGGSTGRGYTERNTVQIVSALRKLNEYLIGLAGDTNGLFFRHCNRRGEVGESMKEVYDRSSYIYYLGSYLRDLPLKDNYDVMIKANKKNVKLIYPGSFRLLPEYRKMDKVDRWIQMLEALYGSAAYDKISFNSSIMQFPYGEDRTLVLTVLKPNFLLADNSACDIAVRYFNPQTKDDSQQLQSWNIGHTDIRYKNLWLFIGSSVRDGEYNYRYLIRNSNTGDLGNSKGRIKLGLNDHLLSSSAVLQENAENQALTNLLSRDIYKIQDNEDEEPPFLFDVKLIPFIYGEKIIFPIIGQPLVKDKPAFLMFMYNFDHLKNQNFNLSYGLFDLVDNDLGVGLTQSVKEDEFPGGWRRVTLKFSPSEIPSDIKELKFTIVVKDALEKQIESQNLSIRFQ